MKDLTQNKYITVLMTSPDREEARKIAKVLLEERKAACVGIFPRGESYFWWRGKIEREDEFLLIAKTRAEKFPSLVEAVKKVHSYEVPEIISLPITGGNQAYLDWLGEEVPDDESDTEG